MANFDTGQDILRIVLSRGEELGIGSSDHETDVKEAIQAALVAVASEGFPWPWNEKQPPGILQTLDALTTGTVAVTNNSAAITFSAGPADSIAGRKFMTDADGIVYRILSHSAGSTSATLDANYLGATATGQAFHVFQDEYSLASDFLRPLQKPFLRDMHGNCHVDLIDEDELAYKFNYPGNLDNPVYCCFIGPSTIRLAPAPASGKRYEYAYLFHPTASHTGGVLSFDADPTDDALVITPAEDRIVLVFYGLANLLHDKNDSRAAAFGQAAVAKIQDMKRFWLKHRKPRVWVRSGLRLSAFR